MSNAPRLFTDEEGQAAQEKALDSLSQLVDSGLDWHALSHAMKSAHRKKVSRTLAQRVRRDGLRILLGGCAAVILAWAAQWPLAWWAKERLGDWGVLMGALPRAHLAFERAAMVSWIVILFGGFAQGVAFARWAWTRQWGAWAAVWISVIPTLALAEAVSQAATTPGKKPVIFAMVAFEMLLAAFWWMRERRRTEAGRSPVGGRVALILCLLMGFALANARGAPREIDLGADYALIPSGAPQSPAAALDHAASIAMRGAQRDNDQREAEGQELRAKKDALEDR